MRLLGIRHLQNHSLKYAPGPPSSRQPPLLPGHSGKRHEGFSSPKSPSCHCHRLQDPLSSPLSSVCSPPTSTPSKMLATEILLVSQSQEQNSSISLELHSASPTLHQINCPVSTIPTQFLFSFYGVVSAVQFALFLLDPPTQRSRP